MCVRIRARLLAAHTNILGRLIRFWVGSEREILFCAANFRFRYFWKIFKLTLIKIEGIYNSQCSGGGRGPPHVNFHGRKADWHIRIAFPNFFLSLLCAFCSARKVTFLSRGANCLETFSNNISNECGETKSRMYRQTGFRLFFLLFSVFSIEKLFVCEMAGPETTRNRF